MEQIKKHQTLSDFTAQHAGTLEALVLTASLNGVGITDDIEPGTQLQISTQVASAVNYYKGGELDITTKNVVGQLGGIGYMQIGTNFKVS